MARRGCRCGSAAGAQELRSGTPNRLARAQVGSGSKAWAATRCADRAGAGRGQLASGRIPDDVRIGVLLRLLQQVIVGKGRDLFETSDGHVVDAARGPLG
eukprot:scaffold24272_cov27-Tisochrysis_lutea.AAC.3